MKKKTIGEMIAELEAELRAYRQADVEIERFKLIFANTPDENKRSVLADFMTKHGMNPEELLTPTK